MRIKGTTAAEIAGSVRDQVASGELAPQALFPRYVCSRPSWG